MNTNTSKNDSSKKKDLEVEWRDMIDVAQRGTRLIYWESFQHDRNLPSIA